MPRNCVSRKAPDFAFLRGPVPYNPPLRRAERTDPCQMPNSRSSARPLIGIIMGSRSDWPTLQAAAQVLEELKVPFETLVVSAHRTPQRLYDYATNAANRGLKAIIAGAGGAAHLPGMTASMTVLPVLGVPVETRALKGLDSLLSIAQMPGGIPVATFAIGEAGAKNAGLFAVALLANDNSELRQRLERWRARQTRSVPLSPSDKPMKRR
jgi:5-(carboxyamino)imidazole ribonucleotide mutase